MDRAYKVHEFAELAGITVRALHHYDRLGLLKSRRTAAGYRVYVAADLARLEQVVALKYIGLPLKQIRDVLDGICGGLPEALARQRELLERRRQHLAGAIRAIEQAERSPNDPAALKRIIEVMAMEESMEEMKRYYMGQAWRKVLPSREPWVSAEWCALYREMEAGAEPAEALAERWMRLLEAESGSDPDVRMGLMRTWYDRDYWPAALKQRLAPFPIAAIWELLSRTIVQMRARRWSDAEWLDVAGLSAAPPAWRQVFLDASAAVAGQAADDQAMAVAARWRELDPDHARERALVERWREVAQSGTDPVDRQIALFNLERIWGLIGKAVYRTAQNEARSPS